MTSNQDARDKIREKSEHLPSFCIDAIFSMETEKSPLTLLEYAKDWHLFFEFLIRMKRTDAASPSDVTIEDMKSVTERDLLAFFESMTKHIRTYVTSSGQEKQQIFRNGPSGKARKLASLRTLYHFLIERKMVVSDPSLLINIKVPQKNKLRNRLRPEEVQAYFQGILGEEISLTKQEKKYHGKVVERDYIISLLFAYMGIRVGELVALDLADIKIEKKSNRSYIIVTRKGGDEQAIAMPERIVDDVADYLEVRKEMKNVPKTEAALFLSLQKKRIDPRTIRQLIDKYRKRAGIDVKITPHVFRRTFGTKHYNDYGDMYLTARILGHSSAETTRRHYADPDETRERKSMEGFEY